MLFAGAIEFSTGEILLILTVVVAVVLVVSLLGALTAWGLSRRRVALPLGALAFWVGAVVVGSWLRDPAGFIAGWLASASVGLALAPGRPGHPTEARKGP